MNYRHAFHAGNFADIFKHALLTLLIEALHEKEKPCFFLDTHAGTGGYSLLSEEAERGQERAGGIDLLEQFMAKESGILPGGYLKILRELQKGDTDFYPGSPLLISHLLKPGEHLACCELHPEDYTLLAARFRSFRQVSVHHRDGYEATEALLPPLQKRGLVFIDPPFEQQGEYERVLAAVALGKKRFPGGVFAFWYPIKHYSPIRAFYDKMKETGFAGVTAAELLLRPNFSPDTLNGCGLMVLQPPYSFRQRCPLLLEALGKIFQAEVRFSDITPA